MGPYSQRMKLGDRLRKLREDCNLRTADAARPLQCSASRITRIEKARPGAQLRDIELEALLRLYGKGDDRELHDELLQLLRDSQQEGWWESYADVMPPNLDSYVALEGDAASERAWEPLIVHGLVQTEKYARAMYTIDRARQPAEIDRLVESRMERQRALNRSQPLGLWAIMDEGVLRRPVGGPEAMRQQIDHLIELASHHPAVTIQIVPVAVGAHAGLMGAFSLLEVDDTGETVVYIESNAGNLVLTKPREVRPFRQDFDWLCAASAVDPDQSIALMKKIAEEIY